jgi:Conserved TM helix
MRYAADYGQQFAGLIGSAFNIALKVIVFLGIIGLGGFVGAWLRKWITHLLRRVGFDRAVELGGLQRMLGRRSASELSARLVFLTFMLFVLQLAFGIFGPNPVGDLIRDVVAWLPRLFVAVVIVVVAAAIAGWVRDLIAEALGGLGYGGAVAATAQVLILALAAIAALNQIGVATAVTLPVLIAALATVAGVTIVGVGGGLIRPMERRWDRILNRAEAESATAAEKVRAHRAAAGARGRRSRDDQDGNGFGQRAYSGRAGSNTLPSPEAGSIATATAVAAETRFADEMELTAEAALATQTELTTATPGTGADMPDNNDRGAGRTYLPAGAKLGGIARTDASKATLRPPVPAGTGSTDGTDATVDMREDRPGRPRA